MSNGVSTLTIIKMDIVDLDTNPMTTSSLSLEDRQKLLDIRWGRRDCDFIKLNTNEIYKLRLVGQSHNNLTFVWNQSARAELKVYVFYVSSLDICRLYKRYKVALTSF